MLLRLHDLHNVSLDNEGTLSRNLFRLLLFFCCCFGGLLADHLLRNQVRADLARFIGHVYLNLFIVSENRLVDLFLKNLDLWVTELLHCSDKLILSNMGSLLDLRASVDFSLVEHAENSSLESVDQKCILLRLCEVSLQLDLSMRIHPCQLPVLILRFEPLLEAANTRLHLWW